MVSPIKVLTPPTSTLASFYIFGKDGEHLAEYEGDLVNNANLKFNYIIGPGGQKIGRINSDNVQFFLTDHLGSTRVMVNHLGDMLRMVDYYPFGMTAQETGYPNHTTDKKFTGKILDDMTGLYSFGARYYDPELGRFISVDPLAHKYPGHSPYNYTLNNPLRYIDPDGRGVLFYPVTITFGVLWRLAALYSTIDEPRNEVFYNREGKEIGVYAGRIDGEYVYMPPSGYGENGEPEYGQEVVGEMDIEADLTELIFPPEEVLELYFPYDDSEQTSAKADGTSTRNSQTRTTKSSNTNQANQDEGISDDNSGSGGSSSSITGWTKVGIDIYGNPTVQ